MCHLVCHFAVGNQNIILKCTYQQKSFVHVSFYLRFLSLFLLKETQTLKYWLEDPIIFLRAK